MCQTAKLEWQKIGNYDGRQTINFAKKKTITQFEAVNNQGRIQFDTQFEAVDQGRPECDHRFGPRPRKPRNVCLLWCWGRLTCVALKTCTSSCPNYSLRLNFRLRKTAPRCFAAAHASSRWSGRGEGSRAAAVPRTWVGSKICSRGHRPNRCVRFRQLFFKKQTCEQLAQQSRKN